jgi:DNA replicative helicase MCM subunit Mcm2 (Cdc46/Mcm family)
LRRYITQCRETDYSLSEGLQKEVQEDFVRMRQAGQGRVTVDHLHGHLVLARYGKAHGYYYEGENLMT